MRNISRWRKLKGNMLSLCNVLTFNVMFTNTERLFLLNVPPEVSKCIEHQIQSCNVTRKRKWNFRQMTITTNYCLAKIKEQKRINDAEKYKIWRGTTVERKNSTRYISRESISFAPRDVFSLPDVASTGKHWPAWLEQLQAALRLTEERGTLLFYANAKGVYVK